MAIPDSITIKGNVFKAEDLVAFETFFVPTNSPISEAIQAIKKFRGNAFLDNATFRIIASKTDYEIIHSLPEVEYTTRWAWTVTYQGEVYLVKDQDKKWARININTEDAPPGDGHARIDVHGDEAGRALPPRAPQDFFRRLFPCAVQ